MPMKQLAPPLIALLLISSTAYAQFNALRPSIERIARSVDGVVGVAILDMKTGDTVTVNGDRRFPMQSVYKFPIALAVLDRVQEGALALSQEILVTASDLLPNTWSPLREAHPAGNVSLTLDSIVAATVALSDNNGCDILLWQLGGPATVDHYVRSLGIEGMAVVSTEEEMHLDDSVQYRNVSTPTAMAQLLYRFSQGSLLKDELRSYLWTIMVESPTGAKRLKGLLPASAVVAHKTGSSGTNARGISAATNDAGIIVMPDGRRVAVVVFVSDSKAKEHDREAVIARIARAVWDVYETKPGDR
ncbi:MAG: class A beta-lactamase, subclass A2 [Bacteroidetes bacterium]|jgi:beta-lactamase class A|nr:class A beta-lactamase, subclass A2 [Bacteroidota bacterium]